MSTVLVTPGTSRDLARHLNAPSTLPKIADHLGALNTLHLGIDWAAWRNVRANILDPKFQSTVGNGLGGSIDIFA